MRQFQLLRKQPRGLSDLTVIGTNGSQESGQYPSRQISPMFVAESERRPNHTHVLLITTGSVASIKAPLIVKELRLVRLNWNNPMPSDQLRHNR
jgi:hypothetical protein